MKVYFWRSSNDRILRCRRGVNTYRPLELSANTDVCEYNALTNSILELVERNVVVGVADIDSVVPAKIQLNSTGNIAQLVEEAENVESSPEESVNDQVGDESTSEDEAELQRMGEESVDNAGTFSGTAEVQVSSVAEGDDGLDGDSERGSEIGSDGVHSDDDGVDTSQDRPVEEVDPVPSSDEDSSGYRF